MKIAKKPATVLMSLLIVLLLLAEGCEGIVLPSASPAGTTASPTASSPAATASPEETATVELTASPAPATAEPTATATPEATATATVEETATPTEAPTATPTPVATAHPGDRADVAVTKYYDSTIPEGLTVALKYKTYTAPLDYFVVMRSSAVRELPKTSAKSLQSVRLANRLGLIAQVKGSDGKVWYRVWTNSGKIGYIPATAGNPRQFQVASAWEKAKALKQTVDLPNTVRVSNYNNRAGLPPKLPGGKDVDAYGILRDQGAPAYLLPDKTSSFRYLADGSVGHMISKKGDFAEIYFPYIDEVRYVPMKFLSYKKDSITTMTQCIVVDRKNQNIITFEYRDGGWFISSMCYVSTGKSGGSADPTPLGYYVAIDRKRPGKKGLGEFWFLLPGSPDSGPDMRFEGYAPYAIRFTGGAYLHGLPVGVSYDANNQVIFTGRTYEFNTCLGTTPQSHMCVRNYTSHAKFMWNWVKIGQATVIVME